ncbi:hypothetical protein H6G91_04855 [Nostoc muscorum FACHB-395]|jgi:hypothetical protein|nr:hypothetical protein [Desmonostoc muscorum FACHB-395]
MENFQLLLPFKNQIGVLYNVTALTGNGRIAIRVVIANLVAIFGKYWIDNFNN